MPRGALLEHAYAAALALLAVWGALTPARTPPAPEPWRGPFATYRPGEAARARTHEPVDLEVAVPAPPGDPFDAVATATFTGPGGRTYAVEAFYAGGGGGSALFRFRFTPPAPGPWRYVTASDVPGLDGLAGTVVAGPAVLPGPLLGVDGRFVLVTASGASEPTTYNVLAGPGGRLERLGDLPRGEEELNAAAEALVDRVAAAGFDALHVGVYNEWFSLGAQRHDRHGSARPDPRTFQVLETLAAQAQRRGLFLHVWLWGDEARRLTPLGLSADPTAPGDAGGPGGLADGRLTRYLAARLGPLPNWTLSYGFDLDEWATVEQVMAWAARSQALLPVPHLLSATAEGAFEPGAAGLPLASRDVGAAALAQDPFERAATELTRASGRPLLIESDLPVDDWGPEGVRRGLWRLTLAGGVGAVWYAADDALPDPEAMSTFRAFWSGRLPLGGASWRLPGGPLVLTAADGRSGVVYAEDAASLPLEEVLPADAVAVAVDTRAPYEELPVAPGAPVWTAPYASDWAVAFSVP